MEEGKGKGKEEFVPEALKEIREDIKEKDKKKAQAIGKEMAVKSLEKVFGKETKEVKPSVLKNAKIEEVKKEEDKAKIVPKEAEIKVIDDDDQEGPEKKKVEVKKPPPMPKVIINNANLSRKEVDDIKAQLDKIVDNKENPMTVPSIDYFRALATIPPEKRPKTIPVRMKRVRLPKLLREKPKPLPTDPKMPAPRRRVSIIGFADTTRMMADFNEPTMEIWGLNELYLIIPRADRWFEMHPEHNIKHSFRDKRHFEWLKNCKMPVYMPKMYKEIPTCVVYPMPLMKKMFGPIFSSSIVEMMAIAIYEGFDEINLYGVDMALKKEYGAQKSGCEFFIGLAVGLGIKVYLPLESDLMKVGFQYGYDDPTVFSIKMKEKNVELRKKIASAQQQERFAHDGVQRLSGALELNTYYEGEFVKAMAEEQYKYQ